ncbi:mucin-like protein [Ylistrum balloti]|uniref:mucin-like protein n=1 Tax=Ylistrum balloti TaxID=509963 RepID=UPI002905B648|nr:mucin-like protein [Ylistrum balloti]
MTVIFWYDQHDATSAGFFAFGQEEGDTLLTAEGSSNLVTPTVPLATTDNDFNNFYIDSNGIISLNSIFVSLNPEDFSSLSLNVDLFAPFWMDVGQLSDTRIYYQLYDKNNIRPETNLTLFNQNLDSIDQIVRKYKAHSNYISIWSLVVTWLNVHPEVSAAEASEKLSFQAVITTNGINSYYMTVYNNFLMVPTIGRQISIGYKLGTMIEQNQNSFQRSAAQMDVWRGNQDLSGFYFYEITPSDAQGTTPLLECLNWYSGNLAGTVENPDPFANFVPDATTMCPCDFLTRILDWRFSVLPAYIRDGMYCVSGLLTSIFPSTRECCYTSQFGFLIREESRFLARHPLLPGFDAQDNIPRRQCCTETNGCRYWRRLRPITKQCRVVVLLIVGFMYGDPHFTSLDGKTFTFNGKGEYIMLKVSNGNHSLELQARTGQATSENGTDLRATVFTAFAGKDFNANVSFQVQLSQDKTTMEIYLDGRDFTFPFYNNTNFSTIVKNQINAVRLEDTLFLGLINSDISLRFQVSARMLSISPSIPEGFRGSLTGLLGNFNGNPNDDFIFPNGTILPNVNMTEKEIFDYGQTWAVNETTSCFDYFGKTFSTFNDPSFVPAFQVDFNSSQIEEAKRVCGSQSDACIYDYLVTNDQNVAMVSKNIETEAEDTLNILGNTPPVVNGTTSLIAEVGKLSSFTVTASDADPADTPSFVIINQPVANFSFDNTSGLVSWTPENTDIVSISLTAVDNYNISAPPLEVEIILCPGCSGNGTCNYTQTIPTTNDNFQYATCDCNIGYEGANCSQEVDGCAGSPCSVRRNCTDLSPQEEVMYGAPFICSDCPAGFEAVGSLCKDIDECLNASVNMCNQNCTNTEGSFMCSCLPGYRELQGVCTDINECIEDTDGCEQMCNNNEGSFTCGCFFGYQIQADERSCSKVVDVCQDLNCSYACSNNTDSGNLECECPGGYELDASRKNCVDINECERNICQQECSNNIGSYECSCLPGYSLDPDKTSCKACDYPYWGRNCANTCACGEGASECDAATGCVCKSGWTGPECNNDINECKNEPLICGADKTCENINGFYRCNCYSGYEKINTTCVNINECQLETHNCPSNSVCEDNDGGFTCQCLTGYVNDRSNLCKNIDECAIGTHGCTQICKDVDGSYNCFCEDGFQLASDRKTCVKVSDTCAAFSGLTCSYACRLNGSNPECYCPNGYQLTSDQQTCEDVNECTAGLDLCNQDCSNNPGGYTCSCAVGYRLENDGRTCAACDSEHWGQGCANICHCGPAGTTYCDSVTGCVCKDGWTGPQCTDDVNECLIGNRCPGINEECMNIQGSYMCRCVTGYSNVTGTCQDINECNTTNVCTQDCTNTPGSYTCSCFSGFKGTDTCTDIDECAIHQDGCDHFCSNSIGSYRCSCRDGYDLDLINRKKCIAKVTCTNSTCSQSCAIGSNGRQYCSCEPGYALAGDNVTCNKCDVGFYGRNCSEACACEVQNTISCDKMNGQCTCKSGWNGTTCADNINECDLGLDNCPSKTTTCLDTNGTFVCDCHNGLAVNNDGQCVECPNGRYGYHCDSVCACNFNRTDTCNKVNGTCNCMTGWTGIDCNTNINECDVPMLCGSHADCIDTNGSYECVCVQGYSNLGNGTCIDQNECLVGAHNCSQYANCTNTDGSFTCACNGGFEGDGYTCTDIDECINGSDICLPIANCTNTIGSFYCKCGEGLPGDGIVSCTGFTGRMFRLLTSFIFTVTDTQALENTTSSYYQGLLSNFTEGYNDAYNRTIPYFNGVRITAMRAGSLIVEHELYTLNNPDVVNIIIKAIQDITFEREPFYAGGQTIPVILYGIQDLNGTFRNYTKADFSACDILDALEPCTNGSVCTFADGLYSCQPPQSMDNFAIIMGLGVGLTLLLLCTCCCCMWLVFMWRKKRRRHRQLEELTRNRSRRDR